MKTRLGAALAALGLATATSGGEVHHVFGGRLEVSDAAAIFSPMVYLKGWTGQYEGNGPYDFMPVDGVADFTIGASVKDADMNGRVSARPDGQGNVDVSYELVSRVDRQYEGLALSCSHEFGDFMGGWLEFDGKKVAIPAEMGKSSMIWSGTATRLSFCDSRGTVRLALAFTRPQRLMVQDDRFWGKTSFVCRYYFVPSPKSPAAGASTVAKGERISLGFKVLKTASPLTVSTAGSVVLHPGQDWIPAKPVPLDIKDGSALDFSAVRGGNGPAGQYGRVVARDGHFEFEGQPGVVQRFYGVNICESANVADPAASRRLAAHLRKMGYNSARIHHHERHLLKAGYDACLTLDAAKMHRFDELAAAFINNGLYLSTDLYVSRMPIAYRALGIDRDGTCDMQEFKELLMVHEGAVSNYLAFARAFLSHVNPLTGRSYAQEPALAFISLVNEGNLGNCDMQFMSRTPEFAQRWKAWLAQKRIAEPEGYAGIPDALPRSRRGTDRVAAAYAVFIRELDQRFASRVTTFLRDEMKCHALTTNLNGWTYPLGLQLARSESYDFVDGHFYHDQPFFLGTPWRLPSSSCNENPVMGSSMGAMQSVAHRIVGKPFTISEYNYCGPGRFRGIGGMLCSSLAALQDWSGLWRFDWGCSSFNIEGYPAKIGFFELCGDPLLLASERAAVCLFLRGDMPVLKRTLALDLPSEALRRPIKGNPDCRTSFPWAGWFTRIGMSFDGCTSAWKDRMLTGIEGMSTSAEDVRKLLGVPDETDSVTAGDGAVTIGMRTGAFHVNTPRTSGGFVESGRIAAGVLTADVGNVSAAVWASSVDGLPLTSSRRILLTHLTDMQNDGICYADSSRRILLKWGELPHLMRRGEAKVSLAIGVGPYHVFALSSDGSRRDEIASSEKDGCLAFRADVARDRTDATYLYEIVRSVETER